jgi:hypothetical protein
MGIKVLVKQVRVMLLKEKAIEHYLVSDDDNFISF